MTACPFATSSKSRSMPIPSQAATACISFVTIFCLAAFICVVYPIASSSFLLQRLSRSTGARLRRFGRTVWQGRTKGRTPGTAPCKTTNWHKIVSICFLRRHYPYQVRGFRMRCTHSQPFGSPVFPLTITEIDLFVNKNQRKEEQTAAHGRFFLCLSL